MLTKVKMRSGVGLSTILDSVFSWFPIFIDRLSTLNAEYSFFKLRSPSCGPRWRSRRPSSSWPAASGPEIRRIYTRVDDEYEYAQASKLKVKVEFQIMVAWVWNRAQRWRLREILTCISLEQEDQVLTVFWAPLCLPEPVGSPFRLLSLIILVYFQVGPAYFY